MNQRLTPTTALLLSVPPLMWAGNAVIGRLADPLVSPMTLNFLRWALAFAILLPLAGGLFRPGGPIWRHGRQLAWLGILGVGSYNSLLYLALKTSSPLNVTLVASSTPILMLAVGSLYFGQRVRRYQLAGAALSILGVLWVLCRGEWTNLLQVRLVLGDLYVLLATLIWAVYSWLLTRPIDSIELNARWSTPILAQMFFGLGWSSLLAAGEWTWTAASVHWGWPLLAMLLFVAIGPSILAYRCWGLGIARVGPSVAGFFANLTPVFTAGLSALALGEAPRLYHLIAFMLIISGIVVSTRSARSD